MMPALIISTRKREVWTYENKRRLDRLSEMLNSAQVSLILRCHAPMCPDPVLKLIPDQTAPNNCILQCGCTNRHFEPKPGSGRLH
jgi:hypothetical protein